MNEKPNIRKAKKSDAAALAALAGELGYTTTAAEMKNRLDRLFSASDHGVFVAEFDSIVGWIHVSLTQSLQSTAFAEICGLVVVEDRRGSGVGTQLVAKAERWAHRKGCRRVRVRTNILRDKTLVFYKRIGFQPKKTQEVFEKLLGDGALTGR